MMNGSVYHVSSQIPSSRFSFNMYKSMKTFNTMTFLTPSEQRDLFRGYSRGTGYQLSSDVVSLCSEFYNPYILWTVETSQVSKHSIRSECAGTFYDKGLVMHSSLTPERGFVLFHVFVVSPGPTINRVRMSVSMRCYETNTVWKSMIDAPLHRLYGSWKPKMLPLHRFKGSLQHHKKLTFAWRCELITIEYRLSKPFVYPIALNPKHQPFTFEWIPSESMIAEIRQSHQDGKCFFAENCFGIGDNFTLYLEIIENTNVLLCVQVVKLPGNIKQLVADIILELKTENGESIAYHEMTEQISAYQSSISWTEGTLKLSRLKELSSMIFTVEMTIFDTK